MTDEEWKKTAKEQKDFARESIFANNREYAQFYYYAIFGFMTLVVVTASFFMEIKVPKWVLFGLLLIFVLLIISLKSHLVACKKGEAGALESGKGWSRYLSKDFKEMEEAFDKRDKLDNERKSYDKRSNYFLCASTVLYILIIRIFLSCYYNEDINNKENDKKIEKTIETPINKKTYSKHGSSVKEMIFFYKKV